MRTHLVLALAVALIATLMVTQPSAADVLAGCSGRTGSQVSQAGPFEVGETSVVEFASEVDSTTIQVGVVRPAADPSYRSPVIVQASPYLLSDLKDVDLTACNPFLVDNFVQHGYAVAFVPTRGAGDSDACANLMGLKERADLDQAVTWLGIQPWSSGKVGMIGVSYDGSTPWEVASMGNPHLATIVPASGIHNLFDLVYDRGRNDWRWWFFLPGYTHYYGLAGSNPLEGRDPERYVSSATSCDDTDTGMQATVESYQTGDYDSFGYWAERNMDPDILERYRGSVLLVQGLGDWNVDPGHQYPFINQLAAQGVYVKQLLGQWAHTWPDGEVGAREDFADMLLRWWDRWLKGDDTVDTGPRVEVQDSTLQWRTAKTWPPRKTTPQTLYFQADTTLAAEPSDDTASTVVAPSSRNRYFYLTSDGTTVYYDLPVDHVCATCATFTYDVEGADLHLAGIPEMDLTLVPTGPSGHVSAYVFRVEVDDLTGLEERQLIGWGASDLRFPQGGTDAQPVVASEPIQMTLPLQPLDGVIPAGQQLMVVIDQGHADHMPSEPMFPVELHHGSDLATFRFEITQPRDKDFFEPPLAIYRSD